VTKAAIGNLSVETSTTQAWSPVNGTMLLDMHVVLEITACAHGPYLGSWLALVAVVTLRSLLALPTSTPIDMHIERPR
jgi:hypothetical protein